MAVPLSVRSMESAAASKAFQLLSICEHPPPRRLHCAPARGKLVGVGSISSSSSSSSSRRVLLRPLRAAIPPEDSDGWGKDAADDGPGEDLSGKQDGATAVAPPPKDEDKKQDEDSCPDTSSLKKALLSSLYGADRGLKASSETRAEINELISQLEAQNPTPAPTEALTLLNGKWILVYTSFSELFPLLAAGTLPLVKVGEISQTIDSGAFTVQNSVTFSGPLATTSFSASASFQVRSPKRVQIKFEEGIIGTPKLTDSIDIPDNVDVMGRKIDLTPVQGILRPLQDAATSVARTLSGQPPLKFPFYGSRAQSWLLTTYLDEDLRISRGDGGSVFLLVKDGSSLQIIAPIT